MKLDLYSLADLCRNVARLLGQALSCAAILTMIALVVFPFEWLTALVIALILFLAAVPLVLFYNDR